MSVTIRKSQDRGFFDHDWLKTYHTFSFGDYYDPQFMGFHTLRVINEDRVEGGKGFDAHPHKNMEILTIVLEGALAHKDSTGGEEVLRPGEIQLMTAGSGIVHSEFNPSKTEPVHLLQIWIEPDTLGLKPGYQQKKVDCPKNQLCLLVSKKGKGLKIHQDAQVYLAELDKGHGVSHVFEKNRAGWIQLVRGKIEVNETVLNRGDGASIEGVAALEIKALEPSFFIFFDLP